MAENENGKFCVLFYIQATVYIDKLTLIMPAMVLCIRYVTLVTDGYIKRELLLQKAFS